MTANAALSRDLGINVKTVTKWRKRETVEDRKTGPTVPSSTVLSADEEAMVVAVRRLPLCFAADDPEADALFVASLFATAQDIPTAGYERPLS
jgi:hypothetical protein